jgi:hypothetical protein
VTRFLLSGLVVALAATSAFAQGANKHEPDEDSERWVCNPVSVYPPDGDRDPGQRIEVYQGVDTKRLGVKHVSMSGAEYLRDLQYVNMKYGPDWWSGTRQSNPRLTMVGKLEKKLGTARYTERVYNGRKLETTITAPCVVPDGDAPSDHQPDLSNQFRNTDRRQPDILLPPRCDIDGTKSAVKDIMLRDRIFGGVVEEVVILREQAKGNRKNYCEALAYARSGKWRIVFSVEWIVGKENEKTWIELAPNPQRVR